MKRNECKKCNGISMSGKKYVNIVKTRQSIVKNVTKYMTAVHTVLNTWK